jgi:glycosyltransferase involved in cell wall biosynthesis
VSKPLVTVVVPTSNRASYLEVTLASLAAQDYDGEWETIVVDDASRDATPEVIERFGVRGLRQAEARGPNPARNAAFAEARGDLIALIDDDIHAPPGWLAAVVAGAERHPDADALGGPIRARFDGPAPRSCGREEPPITALDLGPEDREAELVWSANLAFRRRAFALAGPFPEDIPPGGDEEEWLRRLRAAGGRVFYVADAWLEHRRAGDDARLRSLMRSAYSRGRNVRAYDRRRGVEPSLGRELRVLAGCGWHAARRACPQGFVMAAHSWGRVREAVSPRDGLAVGSAQLAGVGSGQLAEDLPRGAVVPPEGAGS